MLSNEQITATLLRERVVVTAFFATVTRNYHLAEDVFQDVCVKAIGSGASFESAAHLLNWARTVGRNRAVDLLRARDGKHTGLGEEVLEALSIAWQEQQSSMVRDQCDALQSCLNQLNPRNQELLRLRYFEGRSCQGISQLLKRKLETVYQALTRAHRMLADCVQRKMQIIQGDT